MLPRDEESTFLIRAFLVGDDGLTYAAVGFFGTFPCDGLCVPSAEGTTYFKVATEHPKTTRRKSQA